MRSSNSRYEKRPSCSRDFAIAQDALRSILDDSNSTVIPDMTRLPPSNSPQRGENRPTSLPLRGIEGGSPPKRELLVAVQGAGCAIWKSRLQGGNCWLDLRCVVGAMLEEQP